MGFTANELIRIVTEQQNLKLSWWKETQRVVIVNWSLSWVLKVFAVFFRETRQDAQQQVGLCFNKKQITELYLSRADDLRRFKHVRHQTNKRTGNAIAEAHRLPAL